jgi:type 1 glutamine amidotransferase
MRPILLFFLTAALVCAQRGNPPLTPEQQGKIDAALPTRAPARPKKPRRLLVVTLAKVGDRDVRGHPAIPAANYALGQMGKRTGAFEAVFSNDMEMFRPNKIRQFDAICFQNTQGVLFEDPELKKSLFDYVRSGHGVVGFHAAIATFVQFPVYDQWPWFGRMLGGTENGGHPWDGSTSFTVRVDDPRSPLDAVFQGREFELVDEVMQLQEPGLQERLHELLSVDLEKSTPTPGHRLLPIRLQDHDFPLTWIRNEGKGRIFCAGIGAIPSTFWNGPLLAHFLVGIQYALGDLKADAAPSARGTQSLADIEKRHQQDSGISASEPKMGPPR